MSRTRPYTDPETGEVVWFDNKAPVATVQQLELLADVEGVPVDDLLDAGLGQKQVLTRLHEMEGVIPSHVLERRRQRRLEQLYAPPCRWCGPRGLECEGSSTRHHFVPRWMMLLLENYAAYSARSICTIPICLGRHRDLHQRDGSPKSIADCLLAREKAFAQKLIDELREQHPAVFELLAGGDGDSYEGQLIADYFAGRFRATATAEHATMHDGREFKAAAVG
jgi:hypothetical protein